MTRRGAMDATNAASEDVLRDRLAQAGARERLVPVLGAGMSRSFGLPLGMELGYRLFDAARGLAQSKGLELGTRPGFEPSFYELMELVYAALERPQWEALVRGALRAPAASSVESARWDHLAAILRWRPRVIATTNLDRVVESALRHLGIAFRSEVLAPDEPTGWRVVDQAEDDSGAPGASELAHGESAERALAGGPGAPPIRVLKVHGDIDVPASWVLTRGRYRDLIHDPRVQAAVTDLARGRSFLFVGYSLADEDILRPLEELVWKAEQNEPHFVLFGRTGQEVVLSGGLHRIGALPIVWEAGPGYQRFQRRLRELFEPVSDESAFSAYFTPALDALRRVHGWAAAAQPAAQWTGPRVLVAALLLHAHAEQWIPEGMAALHVARLTAEERSDLRRAVSGQGGTFRAGGGIPASGASFLLKWPEDANVGVRVARYARSLFRHERDWPLAHQADAALVGFELRLTAPDFGRLQAIIDDLLRDALAEPLEERAELLWTIASSTQASLEAQATHDLVREASELAFALSSRPDGARWRVRGARLARSSALSLRQTGRLEDALQTLSQAMDDLQDADIWRTGEPELRGRAASALAELLVDQAQLLRQLGRPSDARATVDAARRRLESLPVEGLGVLRERLLRSLELEKARLCYDEGRVGNALRLLEAVVEPTEDHAQEGDPQAERYLRWNALAALVLEVQIHVEVNDLASAEAARDRLHRLVLPPGGTALPPVLARGYPLLVEGFVQEARGELNRALEAYRTAEDVFLAFGYVGGAVTVAQRRLALSLAERSYAARERMQRVKNATVAALDTGLRSEAVRAVVSSVQALLGARRPELALDLLNDLRRRLGREPMLGLSPHLQAAFLFAEGDAALELGLLHVARQAFDAAERIEVPKDDAGAERMPIFDTMPVRAAELAERRARMARLEGRFGDADAAYASLQSQARTERAVGLELKALLARAELQKAGVLTQPPAPADPMAPLERAESYVLQALSRLAELGESTHDASARAAGASADEVRMLEMQANVLKGSIRREKALRVGAGHTPLTPLARRQRDSYRREATQVFVELIEEHGADPQAASVVGKAWLGLGALRAEAATDPDSGAELELDELPQITHLYEHGIRLCLQGGAAEHAVQDLLFIVYLWYQQSMTAEQMWARRLARETVERLLRGVLDSPELRRVLSTPEGAAFLRLNQCYGALALRDHPRAERFLDEAIAARGRMSHFDAVDLFISEAHEILARDG